MSPPLLTMSVREVLPATPRSSIVRLDTAGMSFTFRPGQAIIVGTPGQSVRRPYSIACAPADASRLGWIELLVQVSTSEAPGPQLERLQPGAIVEVEGPVGRFQFPDTPEAGHFLFIAGGTGIAPLRSMLRHALPLVHSAAVPPIGLIYSARTKEEFAYADEFEAMAGERSISLLMTVTRGSEEAWTGSRGRIGRLHLREMVPHGDTLCFLCGPPALVGDIPLMLREIGVAPERIKIEEW